MKAGKAIIFAAAILLCVSCARVKTAPELLTPSERLSLAAIYAQKGETELAIREYSTLAEEGNADAYFAMGNLYLKNGDFDKAEKSYRSAIKINPSNGAYHNNIGWLYMQKGENAKAERSVREALRLDPGKSYVYLDTLGVLKVRQGLYGEAEKALIEAARLAPESDKTARTEIYSHLADMYRSQGEIDKALRVEERLKALR